MAFLACAIFIGLNLESIESPNLFCDPNLFNENCKEFVMNGNASIFGVAEFNPKQIYPYLLYMKVCFSFYYNNNIIPNLYPMLISCCRH